MASRSKRARDGASEQARKVTCFVRSRGTPVACGVLRRSRCTRDSPHSLGHSAHAIACRAHTRYTSHMCVNMQLFTCLELTVCACVLCIIFTIHTSVKHTVHHAYVCQTLEGLHSRHTVSTRAAWGVRSTGVAFASRKADPAPSVPHMSAKSRPRVCASQDT